MPASLDHLLVVALSSRALFDFEEENRVFEEQDDRAYMKLQLDRLEQAAPPGVAFPLVKKLLAFNADGRQRVEVVILSRNDPVSGLRVFRSAEENGLKLGRGGFTRGRPMRFLIRWERIFFSRPMPMTCARRWRRGSRRRRCLPTRTLIPTGMRKNCASLLTVMPCFSRMRRNAFMRRKA